MRHAVIMAGGAGRRLWPLSRNSRPKQLLRIFNGTSLLRQSYERTAALLPPQQINVITNQVYLPVVARELPELPDENLLGEPAGRDTANAVGLAAAILADRDPDAVVGVFTADHIITPLDRFREAADKAFRAAEENPDALVTMGVRPNRPDTAYGYVHRGERIADGVYEVRQFIEKPNLAEAMRYVADGEYYWNSGMFAWRAGTVLDQLRKHLPQSHGPICEIARAWRTPARQDKAGALYPSLMKISIDFAVMERADRVLVVELGCHWVDVGSWPAMESVIEADADHNVTSGGPTLHLGSRGNIVVSEDEHLIATIGVDDLVIVHSPDATLICTKRDAQSIKELVDEVRRVHGEQYL
ncbi:MAG: NTP transferase domain-containing protein [Planctomycetes bacterium]|nr:NTP transferase domain-containing protein [Planctomycetota bacterium]